MKALVLRSAALGSSQTWADMSMSLGRDNLLPSSVFRKSSKHPEEREAAAALLQVTPPRPCQPPPGVGCSPPGPEAGGALWDSCPQRRNPPTASECLLLSTSVQDPNLGPHGTQEAANVLPATHGRLVFSQVQGHKPGSREQNLLL